MGRTKKSYGDQELAKIVKSLGRNLASLRSDRGFSQNELSRRSKIALSTINEIENGIVSDFRMSTVTVLARTLKVAPLELLMGSGLKTSDRDQRDLEKAYLLVKRLHQRLR